MNTTRPWTTLILLGAAQFMVVLDITVVNVALPSIGAELDFADGDLQWVVTSYVLLAGGLLLLGGRAADLLGRRNVFLVGLALFTLASLASGLAESPGMLVGSRAAQGLGAALLTPAALSIVATTYTGSQRTTVLTAWAAIGSAGAAAGMLFGGMLTTWAGWESVFLINVPVGMAVGALAVRILPSSRPAARASARLDLAGAASVVGGLVVLVYALEETAERGWGSAQTLVLLALSLGLFAGFARIERRVEHPLVPPATWRTGKLVGGAALMMGATAILVGSFFLNSLYLQHVMGASALETGFAFLPIAVAIAFASHLAAHVMGHAGSRATAVIGLLLISGATALLAAAPDDASYVTNLLPGFLLLGLGAGLVFPSASVTGMSEVDHESAGLASGLMTTAHEVGAALGVAALSAIAAAGTSAGFASGYSDAFAAASGAAAVLGVVAAFTLPAVRPAAGARVGLH